MAVALVVAVVVAVAVGVFSKQHSAQAQDDASMVPSYTVTDLGTVGGSISSAMDINEAGQVVGYTGGDNPYFHAFLYDEDATPKMQDLGTLGGDSSAAYGMNDAGQIVGGATSSGEHHAFLYDEDDTPKMQDLGTLGGNSSVAYSINEAGQVAGTSNTSSGEDHAFLYDASATPKMTDLGYLGGGWSDATDINDAGQIVGVSGSSGVGYDRQFLYRGGQMLDLQNLLPPDSGWTLNHTYAINDRGQIVGHGQPPNGDSNHAFLLTPQKYSFGGFLSPINNPPTLNAV
jgi:probable HAF family extracellular repeat protein